MKVQRHEWPPVFTLTEVYISVKSGKGRSQAVSNFLVNRVRKNLCHWVSGFDVGEGAAEQGCGEHKTLQKAPDLFNAEL